MAKTTNTQDNTQREIVIERREEIGTIVLDPYGTVDPIRAAFNVGTDYMIEHGGGNESIQLEFHVRWCRPSNEQHRRNSKHEHVSSWRVSAYRWSSTYRYMTQFVVKQRDASVA